MNYLNIEKLRGRQPGVIKTESCIAAAVCLPLINNSGRQELLFEVRSPKISTQPGDICFPGGSIESGETPIDTAVRETCEELLVKKEQILLVCPLDVFCNGCLTVSPFLAVLEAYKGTFSSDEVSEVFTVPLAWFAENAPTLHRLELIHMKSESFPYELINGGENYRFRRRFDDELFYRCRDSAGRDRVIWGMTARLIKNLTDLMKQ